MDASMSTPDILGLVNREITPEVIHRAALQLGEDDDHLRAAMSTTVPSVLTALSDVASSETGATHLTRMIRGIDANRPAGDTVASMVASTAGRDQGTTLFDVETGERGPRLAEAVARTSGISADSAHKLLGGATGATLLTMARTLPGQSLDPEVLRALLGQHRSEFVGRLPAPVASLFNGHAPRAAERMRVVEGSAERNRAAGTPAIRRLEGQERRGWLAPLILLAALLLIAIPLLRTFRRPVVHTVLLPNPPTTTMRVMTPLALPNGQTLMVQRGSPTFEMATFLAGDAPVPARFTMAPLNFQFASTQLTPESSPTLDDVAAILRAYPTATVRIESYTDNVGTAASNLDLSRDRSETVKGLLSSRGVDSSRLATVGLGQENPIASDDTESGRAQNRRTDFVVTGR
jgi:outer membrane protein OmpA-like peptidoglycan-associated protein